MRVAPILLPLALLAACESGSGGTCTCPDVRTGGEVACSFGEGVVPQDECVDGTFYHYLGTAVCEDGVCTHDRNATECGFGCNADGSACSAIDPCEDWLWADGLKMLCGEETTACEIAVSRANGLCLVACGTTTFDSSSATPHPPPDSRIEYDVEGGEAECALLTQ